MRHIFEKIIKWLSNLFRFQKCAFFRKFFVTNFHFITISIIFRSRFSITISNHSINNRVLKIVELLRDFHEKMIIFIKLFLFEFSNWTLKKSNHSFFWNRNGSIAFGEINLERIFNCSRTFWHSWVGWTS